MACLRQLGFSSGIADDQRPSTSNDILVPATWRQQHAALQRQSTTISYRFRYGYLYATPTILTSGIPISDPSCFRPDGPVVLINGTLNTGNTLASVNFAIPDNLQSPLEAAAWLAFELDDYKKELEPLPSWLMEGAEHWDLVPPAVKKKELIQRIEERVKAYQVCPKCFIDRDYARLFRTKFRHTQSEFTECTSIVVGYSDRIFSINFANSKIEVIASGENWPLPYQVEITDNSRLPPKFMEPEVTVCKFEGYLQFDGQRLGRVSE